MAPTTLLFRRMALISYIALVLWIIIWHFFLSESIAYSPLFIILLWVVPILLPARGLILGKPYTHAWANFIIMLYLLHGLTAVYAVDGEHWYAMVEIILCSTMFIGCCFFARLRGRELGLGLKKLKEK
ncbi:DUF2069 domain-containing protein [Alteromonadaceae bacterium BrNp21-10]|nr:DUF2069 domain-containing protein [Alteromonadaceae bacterium BrNp21-10]